MKPIPVIAVFDIGKTNKKLLLFDEDYNVVFERSARFGEIADEDGFPCENLENLKRFVEETLAEIETLEQFDLKAINFSAYGASFVYLDEGGQPIAPLYNYLKPYTAALEKQFYRKYGGKNAFCLQTASPALGSLNSGLQLYRIKCEKPALFQKIHAALHLPQYLSFLLTGQKYSEITSIGCHTALWDFGANTYHRWVITENVDAKLPPIVPFDRVVDAAGYKIGMGLHDSSAALIPYLKSFNDPFVLISTGTWSISLNPFNHTPLTPTELRNDCLNYMQYTGKPVKASRFFIGPVYEDGLKKLEQEFGESLVNYGNQVYDAALAKKALGSNYNKSSVTEGYYRLLARLVRLGNQVYDAALAKKALGSNYNKSSATEGYYRLLARLVRLQKRSTDMILNNGYNGQIFVDGGFSRNQVFMTMLAAAYPNCKVYAASVPQSTALGAALAIHQCWSQKTLPSTLVNLRRY